ncbi:unnamed protein product [Calicophoron daubneyi]|uniref:Protein argonaute N-terminal domain-containing protein n=1 Tax=Calicophoron daubneyi TaxID=300641 RepID=A0AAV2SZ78_CALDB
MLNMYGTVYNPPTHLFTSSVKELSQGYNAVSGTLNSGLPTITTASQSNPLQCQFSLVGPIGSPPRSGLMNSGVPPHCGVNNVGSVTTSVLPYSNGPNGNLQSSNGNGSSQSGNGSSPPAVGSGGDGPMTVGATGGSTGSAGAGSNSSGSAGPGGSSGGSGSGGSGVGHPSSGQQHLVQFEPPPRPGRGSEGRNISLRANHFEIRMPKGFLHHYDVSITPEKCPRRVNREIIETMVNSMHYQKYFYNQKPVFDGRRNMYTREPLPISKEKVS